MTYENLGQGVLDYFPCRNGHSKLLFRGPRKKMAGEYIAMIGGTETYGKFIEKPFPTLVGEAMEFTAEESASLETAGALPARLGPHILRIETAAEAALAIAAAHFGS